MAMCQDGVKLKVLIRQKSLLKSRNDIRADEMGLAEIVQIAKILQSISQSNV
jgi:hypothetical protein